MSIHRVLIANRGEIAVRIIQSCRLLGLETVAVVSTADRDSLAARLANRTVCIGPAPPQDSYLRVDALIAAALGTGADAIHPGYGFLAEDPALAEACAENGITFVGPRPETIRQMGNKLQARELARAAGVPLAPGSDQVRTLMDAAGVVAKVGLPVLLKAAAGGGGRGIKIVNELGDLEAAFTNAAGEARAAFGDDTLYVERFVANARHVEVQILGDGQGNVIHLGDRDCSLQRRHQKLVEEAPAPDIPAALRGRIHAAAVALAQRMNYQSAGTVEFLFDRAAGQFYFLEVNTRIQVEHPVTEAVTGIDLVRAQLRIADGHPLDLAQSEVQSRGHAIECRINAEDPAQGFRPSPGIIRSWRPPAGPGIRVDSHCHDGYRVPIFYDSLLAKLIVWGPDRPQALARLQEAMGAFIADGVATTIPFLRHLTSRPEFASGQVHTGLVDDETRSGAWMAQALPGPAPTPTHKTGPASTPARGSGA